MIGSHNVVTTISVIQAISKSWKVVTTISLIKAISKSWQVTNGLGGRSLYFQHQLYFTNVVVTRKRSLGDTRFIAYVYSYEEAYYCA